MFPFSFKKTIQVPIPRNKVDRVSEIILSVLADRIFDEKPSSFTTNQYQIKFAGGSFRLVGNWNLLRSIDHGVIIVTSVNDKLLVSYELWFDELLMITFLFAAFFGLVISRGSLVLVLFTLAGLWSFLFVPNFAITTLRFDQLVRSVIADTQKKTS
jgi:hypothetical protein